MKIIKTPNDEQLSAWLGELQCTWYWTLSPTLGANSFDSFMTTIEWFDFRQRGFIHWPDDWPDLT